MPKISFSKSLPPIEVPAGTNLMKALLDSGRAVASSCGGDGICIKCTIEIVDGKENLSNETEKEKDLRDIYEVSRRERISCQTFVNGDITIDAPYW